MQFHFADRISCICYPNRKLLDSEALDTQAEIFPEVFGKREKLVISVKYLLLTLYSRVRSFQSFKIEGSFIPKWLGLKDFYIRHNNNDYENNDDDDDHNDNNKYEGAIQSLSGSN